MEAVLQFKEYHVINTIYRYNPFANSDTNELSPIFEFLLEIGEENNAWVTLGIELEDPEVKETNFYAYASIIGLFEIKSDEQISEETKDHFFRVNSVAIMYPYLRSIISDLSGKGSEPPIILPTVNIIELMKTQNDENKKVSD